MFSFTQYSGIPPRSPFGSGLFVNGLLCLFFGFLILAEPDLIAYIIAMLLIVVGTSLLLTWWRMRR